jgi:bacteriocin-like protein
MEKAAKKLVLSKETLRTLNEDELDEVTGGKSGICVDSVACQSGVCRSVVCNSGALCQSAVCGSGILCG